MSTHLEELPVELCAHIALFLNRHRHYSKRDNSLLALRSVSHACLDAACRAIKSHPINDVHFGSATSETVRRITVVGKVLGGGCQKLTYYGPYNTPSPDTLNSLQQFVVDTKGGLRELSICSSLISSQLFLEICRACPLLKEFVY